ncbi:MAG: hypothetical protein ABIA75_08845 [Candidatus Neomarinimicrobiota bacterium]
MKTNRKNRARISEPLPRLMPAGGCQRCQDGSEYLMMFEMSFGRHLWVCPTCHYELSRASR